MNNNEIIFLSCLCFSVFVNLVFLYIFVLRRSSNTPNVVHNHYHQAPLPVPRYKKAEENLPETQNRRAVYTDEELKDDFPYR